MRKVKNRLLIGTGGLTHSRDPFPNLNTIRNMSRMDVSVYPKIFNEP